MTAAKITISIPRATLEKARRAVRKGRGKSLSALIVEGLERHIEEDTLMSLLDEMLAGSGGPPTAAEEKFAMNALTMASRRKKKKK